MSGEWERRGAGYIYLGDKDDLQGLAGKDMNNEAVDESLRQISRIMERLKNHSDKYIISGVE